jgi:CRISPR-associated protein Csm4
MPQYVTYCAVLRPQTAFISPMVGDMLFGQLSATLAQQHGSDALTALLAGYTTGTPFAVISDAFPSGYLPKPRLPIAMVKQALGSQATEQDPTQRKAAKKQAWIPLASLPKLHTEPASLTALWKAATELPDKQKSQSTPETHNSINRHTNTTGEGGFAPYSVSATWTSGDLQVYCVLDTARFTVDKLKAVLQAIGQWGYGKDATVGKGKFSVVGDITATPAPESNLKPNTASPLHHWWTLAACAPQGLGFDALHSYYVPVTRYPRHGGEALHASPYKAPLLMADTAGVFASTSADHRHFIGQGLGGDSSPDASISRAMPATVHQGYAPVIALSI